MPFSGAEKAEAEDRKADQEQREQDELSDSSSSSSSRLSRASKQSKKAAEGEAKEGPTSGALALPDGAVSKRALPNSNLLPHWPLMESMLEKPIEFASNQGPGNQCRMVPSVASPAVLEQCRNFEGCLIFDGLKISWESYEAIQTAFSSFAEQAKAPSGQAPLKKYLAKLDCRPPRRAVDVFDSFGTDASESERCAAALLDEMQMAASQFHESAAADWSALTQKDLVQQTQYVQRLLCQRFQVAQLGFEHTGASARYSLVCLNGVVGGVVGVVGMVGRGAETSE